MGILVALIGGRRNRRVGDGGWSRDRGQITWCGGSTSGEDGLASEELVSAHGQESTRGKQQVGGSELSQWQ
jgi:hypothetical protein